MANNKITVQIVGDADSFLRTIRKSESAVRRFGKAAFLAAGAAGVGALFITFREGVKEIRESQRVMAQTNAVLQSTGAVAGVSAKQVEALALQLSNLSGIDDEVIQAGQNVLLSFTNIRNAAGKGNDIFNQATKAVVDFAARTGRDVPVAATLLGKALADPATKLSSLARAGVVFTQEQLKQIKVIQKTRGVMAAQKVVLAELEKRYGGAAKAAGSTLGGQLNVLRERFQDLSGDLLGVFVPSATKAVTALTDFVKKLQARKSFSARFEFIFSGIRNTVGKLASELSEQIRTTNWAKVFAFIGEQWRKALEAEARFLAKIDFKAVGKEIGQRLKQSLAGITRFIQTVDWGKVGGAIVKGIIDFLKGVDWVGLFKGIVRLQVAALRGLTSLLFGAGKELGKALLSGLKSVGDDIVSFFERLGIRIALAILERLDFKVLGHTIIPGVEGLIKDLQARLDALGSTASKTVSSVRSAEEHGRGGASSAAVIQKQQSDAAKTQIKAVDAVKESAVIQGKAAKASKDAADATKKAADAAKRAAEIAARRFAEARDRASSLFGGLFQRTESAAGSAVFEGGSRGRRLVQQPGTSPKDLLAIITAQNKSFAALTGNIAKLVKQGAPSSLIGAAREGQISPEQVAAIAGADAKTRNRIFNQIRRADKLIAQAAKAEINTKNVAVRAQTVTVQGATSAFKAGGGPREGGFVINGGLHLHGVQNPKEMEAALERRAKQRAGQRRGRTGGKR